MFLYQSDTAGRYVLEVVQAGHGQDNVVALYAPHPTLNDRAKLMELRRELIGEIEARNSVGENQLMAFDKQRGRKVLLGELTTIQLIGMVEADQNALEFETAVAKAKLESA